LGGNINPGNDAPLNYKEIPMSEKMQTVVEATKIIVKFVVLIATVFIAIEGLSWAYVYYGVNEPIAALYGMATLMIPFATYVILSIIWGEAKHIVWKRNNNVE
jgi:flagellar biosynthesis protein FlhB